MGTRELLKRTLNRTLKKVIASTYVVKGWTEKTDEVPINLWLEFEDGLMVRIHGSADGSTLLVDQLSPEPSDMDQAGEIIIRDISRKSSFRDAVNKKMQNVSVLVEGRSKRVIEEKNIVGIRFDFELNARPMVLNWGDELYIGLAFPADGDEKMFSEIFIE